MTDYKLDCVRMKAFITYTIGERGVGGREGESEGEDGERREEGRNEEMDAGREGGREGEREGGRKGSVSVRLFYASVWIEIGFCIYLLLLSSCKWVVSCHYQLMCA